MKERFWIFYLLCILLNPVYGVELVGTPKVIYQGTTSVKLRWSTDVAAGARVQYGENEHSLQSVKGEGVGTHHEIELNQLKPNTKYIFKLGSSRKVLSQGSFVMTQDGRLLTEEGSKAQSNAPPASKLQAPSSKPSPAIAGEQEIPSARRTWNRWDTLQDHFDRHGPDFGSKTPETYADEAHRFLLKGIREGLPAKYDDSSDTLRIFDPKTRAFAAYTRKGKTRTYFRPNSPSYFERQPGRVVNLKTLLNP